VDLHSQGFNVVRAVRTASEVAEVELDLIPAFVEAHGHGADEGLDTSRALVVGGAEASAHALVIENGHFEGEVLLQVLDDHDQERELDAKSLLLVGRASDEASVDIASDQFQHARLNVLVSQTLDVAVTNLLVPNLQRARADGVQNGQESALEGVLEHGCWCDVGEPIGL